MSFWELNWQTPGHPARTRRDIQIRILVPLLIALAWYLITFLVLPPSKILILGGLIIAYFVPPSGKESIIPLGVALGVPWWLMAATLAILDVLTALFMILNFGLVLKLPRLGPWVARFLASGKEFMAQRPWISRWRVLGVAFFVFLPLQGTGGVGATLVGFMVGLTPPEILIAVAIGGSLEALTFALGSEIIWNLILTNLALGLAVAAAVILSAVIMFLLFRKERGKDGAYD
jgi:uncharacterized membrane protein